MTKEHQAVASVKHRSARALTRPCLFALACSHAFRPSEPTRVAEGLRSGWALEIPEPTNQNQSRPGFNEDHEGRE